MKKFEVIESYLSESLTLVVYNDNDEIEYIHRGYEEIGALRTSIKKIMDGADPAAEWDGNELHTAGVENPTKLHSWLKDIDNCEPDNWWDVIVTNDGSGCYYDFALMGSGGIREFYVADNDVKQSISNEMNYFLNELRFAGQDWYPKTDFQIKKACCDVDESGAVIGIRIYEIGNAMLPEDFYGESIDITEAVEEFKGNNDYSCAWDNLIEDIYTIITRPDPENDEE